MSNGTIEFNRKCTPTAEYVVLRTIDRGDNLNLCGILLTEEAYSNERLAHYEVLAVGKKAAEEYGLKEGDYVMADRLAQTYKTRPISVMKYVNIICRTNAEMSQFSPLKDMVFVKDSPQTTQNVGGILVNNYDRQLNIGEVVAMNVGDDVPYKVGDNVMISKGGDSLVLGDQHIFIYKKDMIACRVDGDECK